MPHNVAQLSTLKRRCTPAIELNEDIVMNYRKGGVMLEVQE